MIENQTTNICVKEFQTITISECCEPNMLINTFVFKIYFHFIDK